MKRLLKMSALVFFAASLVAPQTYAAEKKLDCKDMFGAAFCAALWNPITGPVQGDPAFPIPGLGGGAPNLPPMSLPPVIYPVSQGPGNPVNVGRTPGGSVGGGGFTCTENLRRQGIC